jgi:hypothetical protein
MVSSPSSFDQVISTIISDNEREDLLAILLVLLFLNSLPLALFIPTYTLQKPSCLKYLRFCNPL